MRMLLPLCLVVLVCALSASAQDVSSANAGLSDNDAQDSAAVAIAPPQVQSGPRVPSAGNASFTDWEVGIGYQFHDIRPPDLIRFHTNGINASLTRFFGDWFGLEADLGVGFGNTGNSTFPRKLVAKDTFIGGGPRFAYRSNSRFEPWGHFLFGLDHFRFNQGDAGFGSNNAMGFVAGGGLDYHLSSRLSLRGEGDYLGTHFFKVWEKNLQIVGGIVLSF